MEKKEERTVTGNEPEILIAFCAAKMTRYKYEEII